MTLSTHTREGLVDAFVAKTGFSGASTLYMSLHTSSPGGSGSNELSGNGYGRRAITFGVSSSQSSTKWGGVSTNSQVFTSTGSSWSSATYFGLWSAVSGGNFISYALLDATETVSAGGVLTFATGEVSAEIGKATSGFTVSEYLAEKIYNAVWRNTSYAGETNYYGGLFSGASTELATSNGYARQGAITLVEYDSETIRSNTSSHVFNATGTWSTINYFTVHNASSGGDVLFRYPSSTFPLSMFNGDSLTLGNADIRFSPF